MAWLIKWCMTCDAEYGREQVSNLKTDQKSHGYCEPCGERYLAEVKRQIEEMRKKKEK